MLGPLRVGPELLEGTGGGSEGLGGGVHHLGTGNEEEHLRSELWVGWGTRAPTKTLPQGQGGRVHRRVTFKGPVLGQMYSSTRPRYFGVTRRVQKPERTGSGLPEVKGQSPPERTTKLCRWEGNTRPGAPRGRRHLRQRGTRPLTDTPPSQTRSLRHAPLTDALSYRHAPSFIDTPTAVWRRKLGQS